MKYFKIILRNHVDDFTKHIYVPPDDSSCEVYV